MPETLEDAAATAIQPPTQAQEQLLESGLYVRESKLPPYQGVFHYRQQYLLKEELYFSVTGSLHNPKRIFRAVYMLMPVWGFPVDYPSRVVGYQVKSAGTDIPGPMEEFACLTNAALTVHFADAADKL